MATNIPAKRGRPTKLTPHLQTEICKYIAAGNYISTACQAVDIEPSTYDDWLIRARQEADSGGGIYHEFAKAIKRAEAEQEAIIVQRLVDAAMPGERKRVVRTDEEGKQSVEVTETGGEWLSAATYLERRHPDRWGRKDRTQVDINKRETIQITHEVVIIDESRPPAIEGESTELTSSTPGVPMLTEGDEQK